MKKYRLLLGMLFASVMLNGCVLDVNDDDKLPGDKFWREGNVENVEAFMLSIYDNFRQATMVKAALIVNTGDLRCAPIESTSISTDYKYINWLASNDLKSMRNQYDVNGSGENLDNWRSSMIYKWDLMYKVVQGSNILIKEIETMPGLTEQEVKGYKAEAVFMRNLAYFFMVRIYGDVPYYTEAYNKTPLPRMNMVTVLQNCLQEMQGLLDSDPDAVILPWSYTSLAKKAVRATRGGALALTMHINLWLAHFDNQNSETYYRNTITLGDELVHKNGGAYELLDLNRSSIIFRGGSDESLFDIVQNINSKEYFLSEAVFSNGVTYQCFTNKNAPNFYYTYDFLTKAYPPSETNDGRVTKWFNKNIYVSDTEVSLNPKEITKFLNVDTYNGSNVTSNSGNQIVFRYADAILLYAEALAAVGEDGPAKEMVNMIRRRAGASDISSAGTQLQDDIYWERVRELIGEGYYYYDLVRTGRIHDSNFCFHPITRANFNAGAWTWPIHREALNNNTHMTLNNYWE